ncbi:MAG: hypothetical protein WC124_11485, partial [Desulfoplanes sp.]
EGKNPFILDSKEPDGTMQAFLSGENRYARLEKINPEESKRLRAKLEAEYTAKNANYKAMAEK